MIQDRNVHRDALMLRQSAVFNWNTAASEGDVERTQYVSQPEYNWRLAGLSCWGTAISTVPVIISAGAVGPLDATGSPLVAEAIAPASPEFSLEEFFNRRNSVNAPDGLRNFAGPADHPFTTPFTISDGFWGVFLLAITHSGVGASTLSTIAASPVMAFPTEQAALDACPKVPVGFGRVAIVTIQAVGGDFIAGTTNTDAALVAAINTASNYGFSMLFPIETASLSGSFYWNAAARDSLKDPSGQNVLGGRGVKGLSTDPADRSGDLLVVTLKEVGGSISQLDREASGIRVEWRPWPVGGEGLGDVSVSQTPPSFVP